jgi:hypothetical protein
LQAWQVKRCVRNVCGDMVREIQIVQQADSSFLVKVRVEKAAQQNRVATMLLAVPEMASSQVRLQVEAR